MDMRTVTLNEALREHATALTGADRDFDPLMALIDGARFVLIGEATHGTHEFYRARAQITKRLIREKGFDAVAVEADWPDAYRVNRYVYGLPDDADAVESLDGFRRFPTWMWRNADVLDFVGWLREHNDERPENARKVGFYGLDLYSLYASMQAVVAYLEHSDPEAARRARYRYSCFDQFHEDPQAYGYAASFGMSHSCEEGAVQELVEMQKRAADYHQHGYGHRLDDDLFYAEQNARVVKSAEEYYRAMFGSRMSSWNLRDRHMFQTLEALAAHVSGRNGREAKIVVWEHNSHLGDARATEAGEEGELNVGQLAREGYGKDAVLIGFSTYRGTVTAASDWDAPAERKIVRAGLPGSYEALFHGVNVPRFLLPLRDLPPALEELYATRLQRAIGVVYRPESERLSHYFYTRLPDQFDVILHFDETRAVEPLERTAHWETGAAAETYPSGL